MNERLKCESRQGAMNVWVWVIAAKGRAAALDHNASFAVRA